MKRARTPADVNGIVRHNARYTKAPRKGDDTGPIIDLLPDLRVKHLYPAMDLQTNGRLGQTCRGFQRDLFAANTGAAWIPAAWRKVMEKEVYKRRAQAMSIIQTALRPLNYFTNVPNPGIAADIDFTVAGRFEYGVFPTTRVRFKIGDGFIESIEFDIDYVSGELLACSSADEIKHFIETARKQQILHNPYLTAHKAIPDGLRERLANYRQGFKEAEEALKELKSCPASNRCPYYRECTRMRDELWKKKLAAKTMLNSVEKEVLAIL